MANEGKGFLSKTVIFTFKWHQASGKSAQQKFPGTQLSSEGREVKQRDVRCAKAIMAEKSALLFFTCVVWDLTSIKNYVHLLTCPHSEQRWSEVCALVVSQEWNVKSPFWAVRGLSLTMYKKESEEHTKPERWESKISCNDASKVRVQTSIGKGWFKFSQVRLRQAWIVRNSGEKMAFSLLFSWIFILSPPLSSSVPLGKLFNFYWSHFSSSVKWVK